MKINEILSIAIRIFGILLFFVTLRDAPQWLSSIRLLRPDEFSESPSRFLQYAMVISFFSASYFMIKFPGAISRILVTPSSTDAPLIEENGQAIQIAGITIVGVYVLTWSIPDLFYNAFLLWEIAHYETSQDQAMSQTISTEIVTVIEISMGLYLALGARGLSNAINKLRA